jgi:hypothetical protein
MQKAFSRELGSDGMIALKESFSRDVEKCKDDRKELNKQLDSELVFGPTTLIKYTTLRSCPC